MVGGGLAARSHLLDLCCGRRLTPVAVCTAHPGTARQVAGTFGIPRAHHDVTAMLRAADLDALVVAVPPRHAPHVLRHLTAYSLPVLVDKPGARRAADLADALSGPGRVRLCVGYDRRYQRSARQLRQILRHGVLGAPDQVRCTWTADFTHRFTASGTYRDRATFADAVLLDTASHVVDLLAHLSLLSPLPRITGADVRRTTAATGPAFSFTIDATPDTPHIQVTADDGPPSWELVVRGTHGTARLTGHGLVLDPPRTLPVDAVGTVRPVEDLHRLATGLPPLGATPAEAIADLTVLDLVREYLRRPWLRPRSKAVARPGGAC
ncbi:MAG: hypothetical protein QG608_3123 [Actinomycetota bacterium]|nr:hypothetical protein [Actinomycetota bacterium]